MTGDARWKEIRDIHKRYKLFYVVMGISVALGVGIWIGTAVFAEDPRGYAMNLVTEGFGVAVSVLITVGILDRLSDNRDTKRQYEDRINELVRRAGSRVSQTAVSAVEELNRLNLLIGENGRLKGEDLSNADLRGQLNLHEINLEAANLGHAKFKDSIMTSANLKSAHLMWSELRGVVLDRADLRCANLTYARLYDVRLGGADLRGAYMIDAKLEDTRFRYFNMYEPGKSPSFLIEVPPAVLPDGTEFNDEVDMDKFTNTNHPQFGKTLDQINRIRKEMGRFTIPNAWSSRKLSQSASI